MPSKGYQTLTLKVAVFAKLVDAYEKKKRDLIIEDIKSYTAYAQKLLEKAIEQDILEGRFEIEVRIHDKVVVIDHYRGKTAEVQIKQRKLFCLFDQTGDCDHVGFVLSDPSVLKRAR